MAEFSANVPEAEKQEAKKIKIEIKEVKESNDTAIVIYTLSDDSREKKVRLIKKNGNWLVHYTKSDTYGEMNEAENADEESENTDTERHSGESGK